MRQLTFNKNTKENKSSTTTRKKLKHIELQGNGPTTHNRNIISYCETPSTSSATNPLNLPISYITSHSVIEDSSPSQTIIVILRNGAHNWRIVDIESLETNVSK